MKMDTVNSSLASSASGILRSPDNTASEAKHICVCICTYKRPEFLRRLLRDLGTQETDGQFTYSIVVADNDQLRSGEAVISEFAAASAIPVIYCVEPRQNIALARNQAISRAIGDYIAFIDDDEFPVKSWLLALFKACSEYRADGALGPVKRHFDETPPKWIAKGDFYQRRVYPTGTVVDREEGRTGNVLLRKRILDGQKQPFKPEFRGGEDKEFFRRMIDKGYNFVWSAGAVAYEVVPPVRWKRTFMLRRALFRGSNVHLHPTFGPRYVLKSLIAVPAYTVALPFALLVGQHRFMDLLVRLFDHLGLLLQLVGINPVREQYIVE
jgi:succinoglycan biosynthesis protein ExoM